MDRKLHKRQTDGGRMKIENLLDSKKIFIFGDDKQFEFEGTFIRKREVIMRLDVLKNKIPFALSFSTFLPIDGVKKLMKSHIYEDAQTSSEQVPSVTDSL